MQYVAESIALLNLQIKIHRIGKPEHHKLIFPLIIIEIFSKIERFQSKALKIYQEMAMKIKK